jgi:signal peptidase I
VEVKVVGFSTDKKQIGFVGRLIAQVAAIFLVLFLIQAFVVKVYYIPSASMEPTLLSNSATQDRILVSKAPLLSGQPKTGDVVVFRKPARWVQAVDRAGYLNPNPLRVLSDFVGIGPGLSNTLVKRVIATGGQRVSCCDASGRIRVDGKPIPVVGQDFTFEPGSNDCVSAIRSARCFLPFRVPKGYLFVLGDNRVNSNDSLEYCRTAQRPATECVRFIPEKNLVGTVRAIVFPFDRWRVF